MYTNADLIPQKKLELLEMIKQQRSLLIAIREIQPKRPTDRTIKDYKIPDNAQYQTNLDKVVGRGIAIYAHSSISHSINEIALDHSFKELCAVEIKLKNKDTILFGCLYKSPSNTTESDANNRSLNALLKYLCHE